jgi:hypothetical protein
MLRVRASNASQRKELMRAPAPARDQRICWRQAASISMSAAFLRLRERSAHDRRRHPSADFMTEGRRAEAGVQAFAARSSRKSIRRSHSRGPQSVSVKFANRDAGHRMGTVSADKDVGLGDSCTPPRPRGQSASRLGSLGANPGHNLSVGRVRAVDR